MNSSLSSSSEICNLKHQDRPSNRKKATAEFGCILQLRWMQKAGTLDGFSKITWPAFYRATLMIHHVSLRNTNFQVPESKHSYSALAALPFPPPSKRLGLAWEKSSVVPQKMASELWLSISMVSAYFQVLWKKLRFSFLMNLQ